MSEPENTLVNRLARLRFRSWHRGTREADYMMGCFFDAFHTLWSEEEVSWFERLCDEEDADIMAWMLGVAPVPEAFQGPMMERMKKLDFVDTKR